MPIYEYRAKDRSGEKSCDYCNERFEIIQKMSDTSLTECPQCGAPIEKLISMFSHQLGFDTKAKSTGLHKLVRKDKGVYEKQY